MTSAAYESAAAECYRSFAGPSSNSNDIEEEPVPTECASDANHVICTLITNGEVLECARPSFKGVQGNPCSMQLSQSPQVNELCMEFKPVPQELRRAMVTGNDLNKQWLTAVSLQSAVVVLACKDAVSHVNNGNQDDDEEDSKERKKKAMDRIVSKIPDLCMS